MNTEELSNRLTNIIKGITNTHHIRIKATIEFEIWDEKDGPIPGIKLFKDFNIYLEREFCEY